MFGLITFPLSMYFYFLMSFYTNTIMKYMIKSACTICSLTFATMDPYENMKEFFLVVSDISLDTSKQKYLLLFTFTSYTTFQFHVSVFSNHFLFMSPHIGINELNEWNPNFILRRTSSYLKV